MSQHEKAQEWIRYTNKYWWNPEDILPIIRLREHVAKMLLVLEEADTGSDAARKREAIDWVKSKYITMSRFEAGVAQQKCAQMALNLGEQREALELFYESRDNLSRADSHHYAIATWNLGCVYWLDSKGRHNRAIDAWQEAIDGLDRLLINAATNTHKIRWYRQTRAIMAEALKQAIDVDKIPARDDIVDEEQEERGGARVYAEDHTNEPDPDEPEPDPEEQPIPIENYFQLFVVYDEIPAGLPAMLSFIPSPRYPAHPDLEPDDYIEVTRVRIGGQEYRVQTLKRVDRQINLVNDWQYYCLKVRGSSMNLAGVHDGDLVLLRYQKNADSGDIVAAVLIGIDDVAMATLTTTLRLR